MVGKQPIVLLKTVDGNRFLPIWIGHPEAAAILMKLQGASTPRPMTHDLLSDLLEQMEAKCERVSVTELRDNAFYATITISMNGSEMEIDSRPSTRSPSRPDPGPDLRRRGRHRGVLDRVRARGQEPEEVVESSRTSSTRFPPRTSPPAGVRRAAHTSARSLCAIATALDVDPPRWSTPRTRSDLKRAFHQAPDHPLSGSGIGQWTRRYACTERTRARCGKRSASGFHSPAVRAPLRARARQGDLHRPARRAPSRHRVARAGAAGGAQPVILLDEDPHMEQRKLILRAVPGERIERLAEWWRRRHRRSSGGAATRSTCARDSRRSRSRSSSRGLRPRPGPRWTRSASLSALLAYGDNALTFVQGPDDPRRWSGRCAGSTAPAAEGDAELPRPARTS